MKFDTLFKYCPVCGSPDFSFNNFKSKRCLHCGFVMYVNPSAAVAAFVVNPRRELLVCVRAKDPVRGTLDLPGGFIDANETAEEAVMRELKEEIGLSTAQPGYLFSLPNDYLYSGWNIPTLDLFYFVEVTDEFQPVAADDVASCEFLPVQLIVPEKFGLSSIQRAVSMYLKMN